MDKLNHPIDLNNITPEQAIQGTIEMFTDMKDTLGETPTAEQLRVFKEDWLFDHGYKSIFYPSRKSSVTSNCFLCAFAVNHWYNSGFKRYQCDHCPICWPDDRQPSVKCRSNLFDYTREPISDILAYIQDEKNMRPIENG